MFCRISKQYFRWVVNEECCAVVSAIRTESVMLNTAFLYSSILFQPSVQLPVICVLFQSISWTFGHVKLFKNEHICFAEYQNNILDGLLMRNVALLFQRSTVDWRLFISSSKNSGSELSGTNLVRFPIYYNCVQPSVQLPVICVLFQSISWTFGHVKLFKNEENLINTSSL
jgi:hypothetical protein